MCSIPMLQYHQQHVLYVHYDQTCQMLKYFQVDQVVDEQPNPLTP